MKNKPQIDPDDVMAFVGNAHGDFGKVKALLEKEPALINAAWDWGGGDWETALGAAAHTGQRDIALHLLEHGARIDLFAAAMLGQLSIVKAILGEFPEMKHALGPHGIPLIAHAKVGGEPAAEVLRFLETA